MLRHWSLLKIIIKHNKTLIFIHLNINVDSKGNTFCDLVKTCGNLWVLSQSAFSEFWEPNLRFWYAHRCTRVFSFVWVMDKQKFIKSNTDVSFLGDQEKIMAYNKHNCKQWKWSTLLFFKLLSNLFIMTISWMISLLLCTWTTRLLLLILQNSWCVAQIKHIYVFVCVTYIHLYIYSSHKM